MIEVDLYYGEWQKKIILNNINTIINTSLYNIKNHYIINLSTDNNYYKESLLFSDLPCLIYKEQKYKEEEEEEQIVDKEKTKIIPLKFNFIDINNDNYNLLKENALKLYDEFDLISSASLFYELSLCKIISNDTNSSLTTTSDSSSTSSLYNLASILLMNGFLIHSSKLFYQIILENPQDSTSKYLLWSICNQIVELDKLSTSSSTINNKFPYKNYCISLYKSLLLSLQDKNIEDYESKMRLASLTNEGKLSVRGNPIYIAETFDRLADTFEDKLVNYLEYKAPEILINYYNQYSKKFNNQFQFDNIYNILDLGCGSGLCGKELYNNFLLNYNNNNENTSTTNNNDDLKKLFREKYNLIGIELSKKMTEISLETNLYNTVYTEDLCDFINKLNNNNNKFHIIISADTFIYVGQLYDVIKDISNLLYIGGYFLLSTEKYDNKEFNNLNEINDEYLINAYPGWGGKLQNSTRYCHSDEYIEKISSKFSLKLLYKENKLLRKEEGKKIDGSFFLFEKI